VVGKRTIASDTALEGSSTLQNLFARNERSQMELGLKA
jgi:hypothetical protein